MPARVFARPSDHIQLELDAPASCLDAGALPERIDAQLGADFATDTQLHAVVQVRAWAEQDYELQVKYETSSGASDERRLRGESCATLADAAALLLAIALNPDTALAVPASAEPASTQQAIISPRIGLLAELESSLMPRLTFGLGVLLGLRIGPLEVQARGQVFLPRAVQSAGTTTTFSAYNFDLGLCVPWRIGFLTLAPCARGQLGRLAGSVEGSVRDSSPGGARIQALALGAEVRAHLTAPLWLMLGGDFTWFLRRPAFVVTDLGEVGRPDKLGVRVYFGPLLAW